MYFQKKSFYISLAFILFFAVVGIPVALAQTEEILLNHDIDCFQKNAKDKRQRSAVMFSHELHMDQLDCLDCHHIYENGENVLDDSDLEEGDPDVSCCSCHNSKTKIDLESAFHDLCISCHQESKKKYWIPRKGIQWKAFLQSGEMPAPTLCGECHVLEKSTLPE